MLTRFEITPNQVDITDQNRIVNIFATIDDPDGRTFESFFVTLKLTNSQHRYVIRVELFPTGGNNFEGTTELER
jgi:hypothetical protein